MLKFFYFIFFVLYNFSVFKYSENLFATRVKNINILYGAMILNFLIACVVVLFEIVLPEYIIMIIYFVVFYYEHKVAYNGNRLKTFFVTVCFMINLFAIKISYIDLFSIIINVPIYEIMKNYHYIMIIEIITNLTNVIYIYIFSKSFPSYSMNLMLSDKNNLKISLSLMFLIYVFLFFNTYILYINDNICLIFLLLLKISTCSIIAFWVVLLYSYFFSKLQLYGVKAENIQKEIEKYEKDIRQLETEANYDYFTSCFKRDFVYEKIDKLLEEDSFFCVVFVDIDGLKITNDVYGHDEGDFYIKEISTILNEEFVGKIIGRIGGDEFLIILEHTDIYATMKCVLRCFEKALQIQNKYNKPYQTSISYGIVEVLPDNKLSRQEIINLADNNMYEFKRKRKKHRK